MKKFILASLLIWNTTHPMQRNSRTANDMKKLILLGAHITATATLFAGSVITYLYCDPQCETDACMKWGIVASAAAGAGVGAGVRELLMRKFKLR